MTESGVPHRSVGAVTVLVPDYDEAIDYFVNTLGFTLNEDTRISEEKRWITVSPGAGKRQSAAIGCQSGGRVFLFLTTDDFWRDYRAFRSSGVEFQQEPRYEEYGIVAVFKDIYGNLWDLIQQRPD